MSNEKARDKVTGTIEVGSSGVKLTLPEDSAKSIGGALSDLLSPFTNAAGYLGDRLGNVRRRAAYKAAKKAVKMLKDDGIKTGDVPPKILLPWLEGASLESAKDTTLQDAWAGLLARAVKSSDAVNVSYIETLKKLGKSEADLLSFFANDTSPEFSVRFYTDRFGMFSAQNPTLHLVLAAIEKIVAIDDMQDVRDAFDKLGLQDASQIIFFSVGDGLPISTPYFEENEHAVANLQHLGLIEIATTRFVTSRGKCDVTWFRISKFGFDLLWACRGVVTGGFWSERLGKTKKKAVG